MSKQYKIKWTDVDEKAARAEIKRYNQRIDYQRKKNPQNAEFLPVKISFKDFKSDIATRKDFTKKMKSLKSFTAKTAAVVTNVYGEKATVYAIEETKKNVKSVNAKRAAENRKLTESPVYVKGKPIINAQKMAAIEKTKPIKFDFNKAKKGEFAKFAERMERYTLEDYDREKAESYKENMRKGFFEIFGKEDGETLAELLDNISAETLYNLYISGHSEMDMTFQYFEPKEENEKFQLIYDTLMENQPKQTKNED